MTATEAKNVVEAVALITADLPGIGKNQKAAEQQGGYKYRGIEDVTAALQPLLAKHKVAFFPRVTSHEVHELIVNGKPWTDTVLTVTYEVRHGPSDTSVELAVIGIGRDNSDKGANKAMTQAFKYALIQTFCIADPKDDTDSGSPTADEGDVRYERPRTGYKAPPQPSGSRQATDPMMLLAKRLLQEFATAEKPSDPKLQNSEFGPYAKALLKLTVEPDLHDYAHCKRLIDKLMEKKGGKAA